MGILAAILAHARRIALDVARLLRRVVEGRREQLDDLELVIDQELVAASIAVRERAGSPSPDSTLQDCAMKSIWHSSELREPSGVPSSKLPRRYHSPSQAAFSSACFSLSACLSQALRALGVALRPGDRRRSCRASSAGTSRARRSRPCPPRRRGSCRRSSRRRGSAAGRWRRCATREVERAHAMLVERRRLLRDLRREEGVVLARLPAARPR